MAQSIVFITLTLMLVTLQFGDEKAKTLNILKRLGFFVTSTGFKPVTS